MGVESDPSPSRGRALAALTGAARSEGHRPGPQPQLGRLPGLEAGV